MVLVRLFEQGQGLGRVPPALSASRHAQIAVRGAKLGGARTDPRWNGTREGWPRGGFWGGALDWNADSRNRTIPWCVVARCATFEVPTRGMWHSVQLSSALRSSRAGRGSAHP